MKFGIMEVSFSRKYWFSKHFCENTNEYVRFHKFLIENLKFCQTKHIPNIVTWPYFRLYSVQGGLSGWFVQSDLSRLSCPGFLSQMSHPDVLSQRYFSLCPVKPVLSRLSWLGCPMPAVLPQQPGPQLS
jgi:hypothetical protein